MWSRLPLGIPGPRGALAAATSSRFSTAGRLAVFAFDLGVPNFLTKD